MPAKSKAQQKAAGAALSAKRGETKRSELIGASRQMYDSMSEKQLDEFASTKRKGKPDYTPDSPIPAKKAKRKRAAKKAAEDAREERRQAQDRRKEGAPRNAPRRSAAEASRLNSRQAEGPQLSPAALPLSVPCGADSLSADRPPRGGPSLRQCPYRVTMRHGSPPFLTSRRTSPEDFKDRDARAPLKAPWLIRAASGVVLVAG